MKHIRRVKVIENSEAKNDVEASILFHTEISNIIQNELDVLEPEYILSKSSFLYVWPDVLRWQQRSRRGEQTPTRRVPLNWQDQGTRRSLKG